MRAAMRGVPAYAYDAFGPDASSSNGGPRHHAEGAADEQRASGRGQETVLLRRRTDGGLLVEPNDATRIREPSAERATKPASGRVEGAHDSRRFESSDLTVRAPRRLRATAADAA